MTDEAALFEAFKAGFAISAEGFNDDFGGPDEEWMRVYFEDRVLGKPWPGPCETPSYRVDDATARIILTNAPHCTRPKDHAGKHRYGVLEWDA